jgi:hypothetical protein
MLPRVCAPCHRTCGPRPFTRWSQNRAKNAMKLLVFLSSALLSMAASARTVDVMAIGGVNSARPECLLPDGSRNPHAVDHSAILNSAFANAQWGDEFVLPTGWPCFFSQIRVPPGILVKGRGSYSRAVKAYTPSDKFELFFALSNSAAVDGVHFFAHNNTSGGIALGAVSRPADDNSVIRVRNTRVVAYDRGRWCGGYSFDATDGAVNYGGRDNVVDTAFAASYTCFGIKIAGQNSGRFVNIDLVAGDRGPDFVADLWATGSLRNVNNSLFVTGSSADDAIVEYTRASAFVFGAVGSLRMPDCASVVFKAGYFSQRPTFGSSASRSANCLLEGGQYRFESRRAAVRADVQQLGRARRKRRR